jgi:chemotaxis receptor (MCP) glutamine deamidase CheD
MFGHQSHAPGIGARNISAAYQQLEAHGFRVAGAHVGRQGYRKIEFDVWSGRVHHVHVSYGQGTSGE